MYKTLFVGVLVCVLMFSCGNTESQVSEHDVPDVRALELDSAEICAIDDTLELFEEEDLPKSADELFNDFFYNYVSDARFQKLRTVYKPCVEVDDSLRGDSVSCSGEFRQLKVYDSFFIIYEREEDLAFQKDTSLTEVVVERVNLESGVLEAFNFRRYNGKWVMNDVVSCSIEDTPNADFLSFYSVFSSDSVRRLDYVAEPLAFVMSTNDEEIDELVELSHDEWMELSSDMPIPSKEIININYGQTCISNNNKLVLVEGVSNEHFLRYRFMKDNGKWMLVEVSL
jgi:hypothetical protein